LFSNEFSLCVEVPQATLTFH